MKFLPISLKLDESWRVPLRKALLMLLLFLTAVFITFTPAQATPQGSFQSFQVDKSSATLSSYWPPLIRQWSGQIDKVAQSQGLDPDFVAAVVMAESNGMPNGISRVGAVGLMGVMPTGPGLEWRPSSEALREPGLNLRWGVAILTDIMRQSGGDIYASLAAYNGGWRNASSQVPQSYASDVLDNYGRAVLTRIGRTPEIAAQWTIAIEMDRGYITTDRLLVLGDQPVSGVFTFGEHIIYDYVDKNGRAYHVRGYVVPVALVVPEEAATKINPFAGSNSLEEQLRTRVGMEGSKGEGKNPRVLLACLPSLSRLRGRLSTRWFAPSSCPNWHR